MRLKPEGFPIGARVATDYERFRGSSSPASVETFRIKTNYFFFFPLDVFLLFFATRVAFLLFPPEEDFFFATLLEDFLDFLPVLAELSRFDFFFPFLTERSRFDFFFFPEEYDFFR